MKSDFSDESSDDSSVHSRHSLISRRKANRQKTFCAGGFALLGFLAGIVISALFIYARGFVHIPVGSVASCRNTTELADLEDCLQKRRTHWAEQVKDMPPDLQGALPAFHAFLAKHGRDYDDGLNVSEFRSRLAVFGGTLKTIAQRNAQEVALNSNSTLRAVHGITKYADWTPEEFKALLGGRLRNSSTAQSARRLGILEDLIDRRREHPRPSLTGVAGGSPPCTKNWADRGDVRNQGQCGDCWTFSTAETLRAAYIQQFGTDPGRLSTQYIVDCYSSQTCQGGVNGCCGGSPYDAMQWLQRQGGIPTQEAYGDFYRPSRRLMGPVSDSGEGITYSGNNPTTRYPCKATTAKAVNLQGEPQVMKSEQDMADYVCSTGDISIIIDASTWQTYTGGKMSAAACGTEVDHAVVVVGTDQAKNAWVVRNSWGVDWGVTITGEAALTDEYSNCEQLAGPTKSGCGGTLQSGRSMMEACAAACAPPGGPTGGYIFLQYGTDTCAITTEPVVVPTLRPAR